MNSLHSHRNRHQPVPLPLRVGAFELHKLGASRYDLTDPYHIAISLPWPQFIFGLVTAQFTINLFFAALYSLQPGAVANMRPGSFLDAFFFSVETLATVGYGVMAPATTYGHLISSTEIFTGTIFTAIVTGLVFFRFSKPKAKIVYADNPVVTTFDGSPTLMIRLANGRMSLLTGAAVRLHALLIQETADGDRIRRPVELHLVRSYNPIFALTWTLMHRIDELSPLANYDSERLKREQARLFVSIEARDQALAASVHDMKDYAAADILFGRRYADAVLFDDKGETYADLNRISLIEPEDALETVHTEEAAE